MPVLTLPFTLPGSTVTPVVPSVTPTYTALIGGTFYTIEASTVNITNAIGQRGTGSITIQTPLGVAFGYGTQALLYDETGVVVYAGYVSQDRRYRDNGARQADLGWLLHDLSLMDNTYRADKRLVFKQYNNQTCGAIITDLVNSYLAAEAVTITSSSVATGPTIIQGIWGGSKSVAEVITWLAQQAGYWWTIDNYGVLFFQPYGGIPAPFNVDGTNVDAMQGIAVDGGNDMMVNKQFVKGSVAQTAQIAQTFKGDGNSRSFTLGYQLNTLVSVTLNGANITSRVQDKGSTGGVFYGLIGDPIITQDVGQTILTSSDTLVVTYIGQYPVLTSAQNATLIAEQQARERVGSGLVETVYSDNKVRSLPAAFQIAQSRLQHYGADLTVLTYYTKDRGLQPGQLQQVTLTDYGLSNLSMLIASVNITDQLNGQTIWFQVTAVGAVGASAWALEAAQFTTFWQNLMAQSFDASDLTDAQDTNFALQSSSVFSRTPSFTITHTKASCPFPSDALLPSDSLFPC